MTFDALKSPLSLHLIFLPRRKSSSMATVDDESMAARQAFDETKTGVKGLVDAGSIAIPPFFHHPKPRFVPPPPPPHLSIPIIDLSLPRSSVLPSLLSAASNWGFFQLINHSVPLPILRSTLSAVRSFHELPAAERSAYYCRHNSVSYFSNIDLFKSRAASWRDTLQIKMSPSPVDPEKIPEVCAQEIMNYDAAAIELVRELMGLLSEGLGVEEKRLEKMSCLEGRLMVCHYYPPCPEPAITAGTVDHSDPGALTLLLQDQIGGLQVRKEGGEEGEWWWVDVQPVEGAIVVNVGDLLQMISNDKYKSVEHRVVANPHKEARVSVATFFNPGRREDSALYGPLPELLSTGKPARYRQFTVAEFFNTFLSRSLASKCLLDHFRLQTDDDALGNQKE